MTKPCGLCCLCDLARFRMWRERIEGGLGDSTDEGSPRFVLIQEIHNDVARRYPIGIAVRLAQVIVALAVAEADADDGAVTDLADLEADESESFRLNGAKVACPASVTAFKTMESEGKL